MSNTASTTSCTEQKAEVTLLSFSAKKNYDQVIRDLERLLGALDQEKALAAKENFESAVKAMEGPLGLMIISSLRMDMLVPSLAASQAHARQYLIGNPLIASKMTQHNALAALYAPIRLLVYSEDEKTVISYDRPSSSFARLNNEAINETAHALDEKFEELVTTALA
jgi:hypothetical protein